MAYSVPTCGTNGKGRPLGKAAVLQLWMAAVFACRGNNGEINVLFSGDVKCAGYISERRCAASRTAVRVSASRSGVMRTMGVERLMAARTCLPAGRMAAL